MRWWSLQISLVCSTIEYNRDKSKHSFFVCAVCQIRALLAQNEDKSQSLSYLVCCFALDVVILVTSV